MEASNAIPDDCYLLALLAKSTVSVERIKHKGAYILIESPGSRERICEYITKAEAIKFKPEELHYDT